MTVALMDFDLSDEIVRELLGRISDDSPLAKLLGKDRPARGRTLVASNLFDADLLNALDTICRENGERGLMFQLLALDNIHAAQAPRKPPQIDLLINELTAYLKRDVIDGWLYRRSQDGVLLPWLVTDMRYVAPPEGKPYVVVSLLANTVQAAGNEERYDARQRYTGMTHAIVVDANDIVNRTIPELLAAYGFFKECPAFKEEYEHHAERFRHMQQQFGRQFLAANVGWSSGSTGKLDLVRLPKQGNVRCVNDEEELERRFDTTMAPGFWRETGAEQGFDRIPMHCYLYLFHLELHRNIWVMFECRTLPL